MRATGSRVLEGQQAVVRASAFAVRSNFPAAIDEYRKALEGVLRTMRRPPQPARHPTSASRARTGAAPCPTARSRSTRSTPRRGTTSARSSSSSRFRGGAGVQEGDRHQALALATAWRNLERVPRAGQLAQAFEALQEAFRLDPTILEAPLVPSSGIEAATWYFYLASCSPRTATRMRRSTTSAARRSGLPGLRPRRGGQGLPRAVAGRALQGARKALADRPAPSRRRAGAQPFPEGARPPRRLPGRR